MAQPISNLPVGAKVKFGQYQVESEAVQPIVWQVAGINHYKDSLNPSIKDHVTLLTNNIIDLRGFDAKEPSNADTNRRNYGNNRYRDSNLRQWLNKSAYPWFAETHSADEPPTDAGTNDYGTGYDDKAGFLSSFTADELGAILVTNLRVVLNTVTDGGGSETLTDKVFLLSNTEVGLANENGIAEGALLPLFSSDASRVAYLTQQAFNYTKSTSKPSAVGNAWYWWLRSPSAGGADLVRSVLASGALNYGSAYGGSYGVRPALNLESGILVSDVPGGDGVYTIVWATPHIITLDKPITITTTDAITKVKLNAKQAGVNMVLKEIDAEKHIYTAYNQNTNTVDIEVEGEDVTLDKLAYTIS